MKKLSTGTDLGGAPITKDDLRKIFNVDIWSAIEGKMSGYDSLPQGMIISGCAFTDHGPGTTFDMTAGVVYLNGQFMRVPAVTGLTYPQYIQPDTVINDTRTFGDGGSHVVAVDSPAKVTNTTPGSGQYIAITSTGNQGGPGGCKYPLSNWNSFTLINSWTTSNKAQWRFIGPKTIQIAALLTTPAGLNVNWAAIPSAWGLLGTVAGLYIKPIYSQRGVSTFSHHFVFQINAAGGNLQIQATTAGTMTSGDVHSVHEIFTIDQWNP